MPIRTAMLDHGGFVRSAEAAPDPQFDEYLRTIDDLFATWRHVEVKRQEQPFSPEWLERKRTADSMLRDYMQAFSTRYTIRAVDRDPSFLPVARFLARVGRVVKPLAILHCDAEMPLHTVHEFRDAGELQAINAALNEKVPLRWWQDGPLGHPCYLFGPCLWELKPSELSASDKGVVLLFEAVLDKDRGKRDRLTWGLSGTGRACDNEYIPQKVLVAAWQRAGGKCSRCGRRDGLGFSYVVPPSRGGRQTAENVQVLCPQCQPCPVAR